MCIYIYICICIYVYMMYIVSYIYMYIYIYIYRASSRPCACARLSIVLEAPIPKMSLGDETSLHVINIYSDKQQIQTISWRKEL